MEDPSIHRHATAIAAALAPAAGAQAGSRPFSSLTALPASAGPTAVGGALEATPITLSSPSFIRVDLADPGEGIARWASRGAQGSGFSGLCFDRTDASRACVNIQHPRAAMIA